MMDMREANIVNPSYGDPEFDGVYVCYDHNMNVRKVFASEIAALRALNGNSELKSVAPVAFGELISVPHRPHGNMR